MYLTYKEWFEQKNAKDEFNYLGIFLSISEAESFFKITFTVSDRVCLNRQVYHFREKNGLECDAVVHLRNGSYGLIEIKLGGDKLVEEGAFTLKALNSKIDTDRMKAPAFLMILTGIGDFAYRRPDGIYVVPIGCLKN